MAQGSLILTYIKTELVERVGGGQEWTLHRSEEGNEGDRASRGDGIRIGRVKG